jgi:hypothetical protein
MFTRSLMLGTYAALAMSGIAFAVADKSGGTGKSASGSAPPPAPAGTVAPPPAPAATAPAVKVAAKRSDLAPPAPKRTGPRAGQSLYDFASLEIGESFGILDPTKTAKKFGSTVTAANHRYDIPVKDAAGNPMFAEGAEIKNEAGAVTGHAKGKPIVVATRKFQCADVDPKTDPDGANLRVYRIALPA